MYPTDRTIMMIGPVGIAAVILLLFFAGFVRAEEPKLSPWTMTNSMVVSQVRSMATISNSGEVTIDWAETERIAATDKFNTEKSIAQLMLAIRDGTWKAAK